MDKSENKHIYYFFHDVVNYLTPFMASFTFLEKAHLGEVDHSKKDFYLNLGKRSLNDLNNLCHMYRLLLIDDYRLNKEEVFLDEMIENTLDTLSYSFDVERINISNLLPLDFKVIADKTLLTQCFLNILKNAIEHQKNCEKKSIEISYEFQKICISNPIDKSNDEATRRGIGMELMRDAFKRLGFNMNYIKSDSQFRVVISTAELKLDN
ncbi:MAG: hypothetical protein CME62_11590 [Halobacteriovoraceae bacterium]|nr:hypothetical protein [Halobacteriovoraceae bacterium]|tara:strand:+ start:5804 stop:6430 length:627 start_codon:yes stop_codon:yes gene_type:complete